MNKIQLKCSNCFCYFERTVSAHNLTIKRKFKYTFCTRKCSLDFQTKTKLKTIEFSCAFCGTNTVKLKRGQKPSKSGRRFCTKTCATLYITSNKKQDKLCRTCNAIFFKKTKAQIVCDDCKNLNKLNKKLTSQLTISPYLLKDMTKKELFASRSSWQAARSHIRKQAAAIISNNKVNKSCKVCGYSKFVEICHIKAVKDFSESALLSEINALNNLIVLCPNHHTEYDNNLLDLSHLM